MPGRNRAANRFGSCAIYHLRRALPFGLPACGRGRNQPRSACVPPDHFFSASNILLGNREPLHLDSFRSQCMLGVLLPASCGCAAWPAPIRCFLGMPACRPTARMHPGLRAVNGCSCAALQTSKPSRNSPALRIGLPCSQLDSFHRHAVPYGLRPCPRVRRQQLQRSWHPRRA